MAASELASEGLSVGVKGLTALFKYTTKHFTVEAQLSLAEDFLEKSRDLLDACDQETILRRLHGSKREKVKAELEHLIQFRRLLRNELIEFRNLKAHSRGNVFKIIIGARSLRSEAQILHKASKGFSDRVKDAMVDAKLLIRLAQEGQFFDSRSIISLEEELNLPTTDDGRVHSESDAACPVPFEINITNNQEASAIEQVPQMVQVYNNLLVSLFTCAWCASTPSFNCKENFLTHMSEVHQWKAEDNNQSVD